MPAVAKEERSQPYPLQDKHILVAQRANLGTEVALIKLLRNMNEKEMKAKAELKSS